MKYQYKWSGLLSGMFLGAFLGLPLLVDYIYCEVTKKEGLWWKLKYDKTKY